MPRRSALVLSAVWALGAMIATTTGLFAIRQVGLSVGDRSVAPLSAAAVEQALQNNEPGPSPRIPVARPAGPTRTTGPAEMSPTAGGSPVATRDQVVAPASPEPTPSAWASWSAPPVSAPRPAPGVASATSAPPPRATPSRPAPHSSTGSPAPAPRPTSAPAAAPSPAAKPKPTPKATPSPEPGSGANPSPAASPSPTSPTGTTGAGPGADRSTRSFKVTGGVLGATCRGKNVKLDYATPAENWTVEVRKAGGSKVEVRFTKKDRETKAEVTCPDGRPVLKKEEKGGPKTDATQP